MRRLLLTLAAGALLAIVAPAARAVDDALARGDAAYAARAATLEDERATPERIDAAIAAYEEALAADPASLVARWKLLRALYYRGDFTTLTGEEAAASFAAGQKIAEEGITALAERVGGTPLHELEPAAARGRLAAAGVAESDAARLYFWASIHWAAWARDAGLLQSVRRGVAGKMHDYASLSAELEPGYYRGGALRLLARLHAKLPRVPFVSGWVDRDLAIPAAERALAIAPDDSGNQLLLALTLIDLAPERAAEARGLLSRVATAEPRPELLAEDLAVRASARERLGEMDGVASAL